MWSLMIFIITSMKSSMNIFSRNLMVYLNSGKVD